MPDQPAMLGGAQEMKNVYPAAKTYRPLPDLVSLTNALDAQARGLISARDSAGNVEVIAGTATNLYDLTAQTFTERSKVADSYSTAADEVWEFCCYVNLIAATNWADPVQFRTLGAGGDFADLITSALKPKARHMDTIRAFLVLGNTNDATDGNVPNRVWWSAFRDGAGFDPAAATQCDYEDVADGGWVQKIIGGYDYGLVFLESQIVRMSYVGPPPIFRFDPVDKRRGTPFPQSVIAHGRNVFFISEEGFFVQNGVRSDSIGSERVDRWFWDHADDSVANRVCAGIDPINKLVIWAFPTSANPVPDTIIMFNWQTNRWAYAEVDVELLARALTTGYTLEGLDAVGGIDSLAFSLDSRVWTGGAVRLGTFDSSHKLAFFDGNNLKATLDTIEGQIFPGKKAYVKRAWPLIEGTDVTPEIALGRRNLQSEARSFGTPMPMTAGGYCPFDEDKARYHSARMTIPAGSTWTHGIGIGPEARLRGSF